MSGLNVAIINNRFEALKYINPVSDIEVVLYDLLNDADYDEDVLVEKIEDLNDKISQLEEENAKLKALLNEL
jgi:2-phospho-L-lactate guanylyltransferase (CobY/MobA/RfbA family)